MKLMHATGILLMLLAVSVPQLPGQTTEGERRQFEAVKAKANKGDTEAQLALATCYANGTGVAKDPSKSAKWMRRAAERGLARAQCLLALDYANGFGVKPDKAEAARWLRRAADQGLPEAQFDLGMCYANGDGVSRNPVEAVALYRKAADQGLADAESELGSCYLEGSGVPKDIPNGIKWTRRAANRGFAQAQNSLGLCYLRGTGVPKDNLQAYKWFNLAASKGDERTDEARVNLAAAGRYLTPEQLAEAQKMASEFKPRTDPAPEEGPTPPGKAETQPVARGTNGSSHATIPLVEASKTGVVNVKAEDESYEIYVDGGFVGNTPAKVKLAEGAHVVEVKKAGFKDYRKPIKITEGAELTLRAVLEKQ